MATEARTRIYVLKARNVTTETQVRLIDAKSETAALTYIGDTLYSIEIARPKDVADAYKAGATMEVAV